MRLLQIMLRKEHKPLAEKTEVRYVKGEQTPCGEIHIEFTGPGRRSPTFYAIHMTPEQAEELIVDLAVNVQLCRQVNITDGLPDPAIFKQIAAGALHKIIKRLRDAVTGRMDNIKREDDL